MVAAILSYYQPCHDEGHNATQEGKSSPLRKRIKCDNKMSDFINVSSVRGGSRIFFRRGCTRLLLYFNTNKPHSFFLQNTSCIRKPQVISAGGAHPLHPPLRSALVSSPETLTNNLTKNHLNYKRNFNLMLLRE